MSKKKIENPVPLDNLRLRRTTIKHKENGVIKVGYSQAALAEIIKVRQETYCDYELGKTPIPSLTLIELSRVLKVSCDYILGLSDSLNIGNKEIEDMTGLNECSIEQLRNMKKVYGHNYSRWISTLNAILEDDQIIYLLSDLIYPPKNASVLIQDWTNDEKYPNIKIANEFKPIFDEDGNGELILNSDSPDDIHRQKLAFRLLESSFWNELKEHINQLRDRKKHIDTIKA